MRLGTNMWIPSLPQTSLKMRGAFTVLPRKATPEITKAEETDSFEYATPKKPKKRKLSSSPWLYILGGVVALLIAIPVVGAILKNSKKLPKHERAGGTGESLKPNYKGSYPDFDFWKDAIRAAWNDQELTEKEWMDRFSAFEVRFLDTLKIESFNEFESLTPEQFEQKYQTALEKWGLANAASEADKIIEVTEKGCVGLR